MSSKSINEHSAFTGSASDVNILVQEKSQGTDHLQAEHKKVGLSNILLSPTLGQDTDKAPTNKAVDDAISALGDRVDAIEETLMGENEITVQYPDDGNYSSLMPNRVPLRALKYAEVPRFRGKSRAWNQLAKALNSTNWYEEFGVVVSYSDGVATITPTAKYSRIACDIPYTANHIMLLMGRIKLSNSSNPTSVGLAIYGVDTVVSGTGGCQATTNWQNISVMLKSTSAIPDARVLVRDHRDSDWGTIQATDIVCYDLTLIFGSGNEPSTEAEAIAQLPALGQYNAYYAGSLVDTQVSGARSKDTNGNVLDTLSLSEPVTLRSARSVADELDVESGVVTRKVSVVDMGTLDWYYTAPYFWTRLPDKKDREYLTNLLCPKYVTARSQGAFVDKTISGIGVFYNDNISVKDSDYSSASAFKSAMSGVYLNYELATPTTESIDPVPDNFLEVEGGGTVETIQTQSPVIDNCLDVTYDIIPQ